MQKEVPSKDERPINKIHCNGLFPFYVIFMMSFSTILIMSTLTKLPNISGTLQPDRNEIKAAQHHTNAKKKKKKYV